MPTLKTYMRTWRIIMDHIPQLYISCTWVKHLRHVRSFCWRLGFSRLIILESWKSHTSWFRSLVFHQFCFHFKKGNCRFFWKVCFYIVQTTKFYQIYHIKPATSQHPQFMLILESHRDMTWYQLFTVSLCFNLQWQVTMLVDCQGCQF